MTESTTPLAVAIDGPAGAGKSSAAKAAAKAAGMVYIDTGAMYRAVALFAVNNNVSVRDKEKVVGLLDAIQIDMNHEGRLLLMGTDVTSELRDPSVSEGSSIVAEYREVREKLVKLQRDMAHRYSVIMEGRDIGSAVLRNAQIKIYLDASPEERARRQLKDQQRRGKNPNFEQVLRETIERDKRDMERVFSPLVKVNDAELIMTDGMSEAEVIDTILKRIHEFRGTV